MELYCFRRSLSFDLVLLTSFVKIYGIGIGRFAKKIVPLRQQIALSLNRDYWEESPGRAERCTVESTDR